MLLVSSQWSSKARFLKWQVKGLFSTRVTEFADTDLSRPLPCNVSATTLRDTDIPSSRCLFQLLPLEPPTDAIGFSSSDTVILQTPTAVQTDETPEKMRARAERNGYKNGTKFGSLTSQIKYDPRVREILTLPTPSARDWKGKTNPGVVKEGSGCIYGETLPDAVERMFGGLLPTPLTRDYKGGTTAIRKDTGKVRTDALDSLVKYLDEQGLLPTPITGEYRDSTISKACASRGKQENLCRRISRMVVETSQDLDDGNPSRLSPLFTEEMMGFPLMWTTLPFLSVNGAPKASKHTETPSSHK
jgi:hypothetical protein